jgi:hypothetical protein
MTDNDQNDTDLYKAMADKYMKELQKALDEENDSNSTSSSHRAM